MGKNASGQTHYLSLSGFEIYGVVSSVCDDIVTSAKDVEAMLRKQRRALKQGLLKHIVPGGGIRINCLIELSMLKCTSLKGVVMCQQP